MNLPGKIVSLGSVGQHYRLTLAVNTPLTYRVNVGQILAECQLSISSESVNLSADTCT